MILSSDLTRRLTYSKYLLIQATSLQTKRTDLSAAVAVLSLHDAAEMFMRVVTDSIDAPPGRSFMDFWGTMKQRTDKEPPLKGSLGRLNQLRVGFKHHGNLPNPGVVSNLVPSVREFFAETSRQFLAIDFDGVSLADMVQSAEARARIKNAETARAAGDLRDSMVHLGFAFDILYEEASREASDSLVENVLGWAFTSFDEQEARRIYDALNLGEWREQLRNLTDRVNMLLLGVDPARFHRFSLVTPARSRAMSGVTQHIWTRDPEDLDQESFDFALEFVIDFALRVHEAGK